MGSCFSATIKADSRLHNGLNPKYDGKSGNDTSHSSSRVSSISVPHTPHTQAEMLQSSNLKSFSFSELKTATRNFRPFNLLGGGGFRGNDASRSSSRVSSVSVPHTPHTQGEMLQSSNLKSFSFSELKTATRNFRPFNLLGGGGFCCDFKGWIDEHSFAAASPGTGMVIAVKRLYLEVFQGHPERLAEIDYLGQLHHPNLVNLLGYCLKDDLRFLVYEFMPKGSLAYHLFGGNSLSWNVRMKIALDAAKGLAFLHSDQAKVIYGDLKASNILLDSNYNAKLANLGLAKVGPNEYENLVFARVMDSCSYTAPEYMATGHLTAKSDVYSFGVVLLEMMSGRRALDKNMPFQQQNLADRVRATRPYTSERKIFQVMDARIDGQYSPATALKVANLAVQCLSVKPEFRPKMEEVVRGLEQLQDS